MKVVESGVQAGPPITIEFTAQEAAMLRAIISPTEIDSDDDRDDFACTLWKALDDYDVAAERYVLVETFGADGPNAHPVLRKRLTGE